MCWQVLRETFTIMKTTSAGGDDADGADAGTSRQASALEWSWDKRKSAVSAACLVTIRDFLEGRPEALQSAFDHSAAILRITLGHKDSRTPAAQGDLLAIDAIPLPFTVLLLDSDCALQHRPIRLCCYRHSLVYPRHPHWLAQSGQLHLRQSHGHSTARHSHTRPVWLCDNAKRL